MTKKYFLSGQIIAKINFGIFYTCIYLYKFKKKQKHFFVSICNLKNELIWLLQPFSF